MIRMEKFRGVVPNDVLDSISTNDVVQNQLCNSRATQFDLSKILRSKSNSSILFLPQDCSACRRE